MRKLKIWYFVLAALNTLAATWFASYIFFFLRDRFGFGNRENLWVSALYGFIYLFAAWQGGKFAQRRGFITSLKVGFAGLTVMMIIGALMNSVIGILLALAGYTIVLLLTWPALEALVSENETQTGVQHNVGVYNCTWASAGAVAYFIGGKLYDWLGHAAVFWVPAGLFAIEFVIAIWLGRQKAEGQGLSIEGGEPAEHLAEAKAWHQPVPPKRFLQMAWLANPFAYVGINTVIAVMPGVASKLGLSPTQVGLFCSVWWFARLATFALLWQWRGWHYRFRWMLTAFIMLIGSFMLLLLAGQIWLLVVAQLFFGFAVGLIYYSSLFYSMDVGGDTQGEHGGLHEAAIGAGIFAGPAVGAAALQFLPAHSNNGVFAVSILLFCGLCGLIGLRLKR
ncbi:MAG TPA: MFS transporter [Verrucomicrobiae bacterium]|jgi:predicted MFS family arabinose efflux permease|nr:MFS transporter [Verrucomicrobiae bacterium]